jgi:hypothetical protein
MGLFFFAWAAGEGIVIYRWVKAGAPPAPGVLLKPSALYLALAVLAEYQPARGTATAFAWAVNLAVVMNVLSNKPGTQTGWPPPKITSSSVILPASKAGTPAPGVTPA